MPESAPEFNWMDHHPHRAVYQALECDEKPSSAVDGRLDVLVGKLQRLIRRELSPEEIGRLYLDANAAWERYCETTDPEDREFQLECLLSACDPQKDGVMIPRARIPHFIGELLERCQPSFLHVFGREADRIERADILEYELTQMVIATHLATNRGDWSTLDALWNSGVLNLEGAKFGSR